MSDTFTEDEVAEMFRAAKPVARETTNTAATATSRDEIGRDTAAPRTAAPEHTGDAVPRRPAGSSAPHRHPLRDRWWLLVAAAVVVAVVVSVVVSGGSGDRNPEPVDGQSSSSAPGAEAASDEATGDADASGDPATRDDSATAGDALPAGDALSTVMSFVAAHNERDLGGIASVASGELVFDQIVSVPFNDLPDLFAWYAAWNWRWENLECEPPSREQVVSCSVVERNRLTDLTGAERFARVRFTLDDGAVSEVKVSPAGGDYSTVAFSPFRTWVSSNHPDDVSLMWDGAAPVLGADAAELFERHLTAYAAQYEPRESD